MVDRAMDRAAAMAGLEVIGGSVRFTPRDRLF
jgi:hypothetical protein